MLEFGYQQSCTGVIMESHEKLSTIADVMRRFQWSRGRVYLLMRDKKIPYLKLGKDVRFRESDLQKMIEGALK